MFILVVEGIVDHTSFHPLQLILYTIVAYLFFICIARTYYPYGLIIFGLLIILFFIGLLKEYNTAKIHNTSIEKKLTKLEKIQLI